jgi:hypothetical protein
MIIKRNGMQRKGIYLAEYEIGRQAEFVEHTGHGKNMFSGYKYLSWN